MYSQRCEVRRGDDVSRYVNDTKQKHFAGFLVRYGVCRFQYLSGIRWKGLQ